MHVKLHNQYSIGNLHNLKVIPPSDVERHGNRDGVADERRMMRRPANLKEGVLAVLRYYVV
jgi:hypothetical protein